MTNRPPVSNATETVIEDWVSETTPYQRVRSVISHVYSPTTAADIADDAHTSPTTARKHLTALAEAGFVSTAPGDHGATVFRRSSESLVLEQVSDILEHRSIEDLAERVEAMRERVASYRAEFGVESSTALTVDRTNQMLAGEDDSDVDDKVIQDWRTTRRNLAVANAALAVAIAKRSVDGVAMDDERSLEG